MKTIFKILYVAAAVSFLAIACKTVEELEPAPQEADGCYGVYFPTQDASGHHVFSPTDELKQTFTIARTNSKDAITVPVKTEYSEDGIFTLSQIAFADGQSEASFTLNFPQVKEGQLYSASLVIDDPQYALQYGPNPIAMDFSVLKVLLLTFEKEDKTPRKALFISSFWGEQHRNSISYYDVDGIRYCSISGSEKCEEVNMTPSGPIECEGGVYGTGADFDFEWDLETNFVTVNQQYIGWDYQGAYPVYAYDQYHYKLAREQISKDDYPTANDYFAENPADASTFDPKTGIFNLYLAYFIPGLGGFGSYNETMIFENDDLFYTRTDYSIKLYAGDAVEGKLPVEMNLGKDVARIKYAVYAGELTSNGVGRAAEAIAGDKEENVFTYDPASSHEILEITLDSTSVYTLVAVTYGKDEEGEYTAQNNGSVSFGYVKAGENKPVVLTAGLINSDKYLPEGHPAEETLEYYVFGKDIKSYIYNLEETADFLADSAAIVRAMIEDYTSTIRGEEEEPDEEAAERRDSILNLINTTGDGGLFTNLKPGVSYTFIVVGNNGFETKVVTTTLTTAGKAKAVYGTYTADDFIADVTMADLLGEWNYYALNYGADEFYKRTYKGTVKIKEVNDTIVSVSNLFPTLAGYKIEVPDIRFQIKGGALRSLGQGTAPVTLSKKTYYPYIEYYWEEMSDEDMPYYKANAFYGAYVKDGHIAFVPNPGAAGIGMTFYAMGFDLYTDSEYNSLAGWLQLYGGMMFVRADVDDSGIIPEKEPEGAPAAMPLRKGTLDLKHFHEIKHVTPSIPLKTVSSRIEVKATPKFDRSNPVLSTR
jgi:hypothetical protein